MSGDAGQLHESEMKNPSRCAALNRVVSGFVGLPEKALIRDTTRRFRFVVHETGGQHFVVLHGRQC